MRVHSLILSIAVTLGGSMLAQAQAPVITGLANQATPNAPTGAPVAPGEIVAINGSNLAAAPVSCGSTTGLSNVCGGVTVTVGGKTAPVRSVAANQVLIQVPVDLTGTTTSIVLTKVVGAATISSTPFTTNVAPTAPAMYVTVTNNIGFGTCFNTANNSITAASPALPGDTVRCLGNGFGVTNPVVPSGQVQPQSPLPAVVAPVTVTVGGLTANVISASLSLGTFVGQDQVVFEVPKNTPGDFKQLAVNVGGVNALEVTLPIGFVGPHVTSVVNSASNALAGLPNAGVAPGSIIVAYGNSLGPATLVTAPGYPWPATLSGTSAQITVGGKSVNLLLYYTSANQIAGLLPSSTPTGTGTITVTYNDQVGSSSPISVLANNLGVYTVSQNGSGAGIVTFPDYTLVSQTKDANCGAPQTNCGAANPGETLIIWGTGLGAVTGDEASVPLPGDMPNLPVQVLIGGVSANVVYRGRSGCCVGEDQIAFVVPNNLSGCLVPLVIQIGNQVSNFSSIAVAPAGRTCVPAINLVPPAVSAIAQPRLALAQFTRQINPPAQSPTDPQSSDDVVVNSVKLGISGAQLSIRSDGPPLGTCLAATVDPGKSDPPILALLDAGTALSVRGPAATSRTIPKSGIQFSAHLGDTTPGNFLDTGVFTFSGPGGADVGTISAPFTVPQFAWTNRPSGGGSFAISRSQGAKIAWTGGDPNGYIQILGSAGSPSSPGSINFACNARTADGSFTLPQSLLLSLPAGGFANITVRSTSAATTFTATGLDVGAIALDISISAPASIQ